MTTKPEFWKSSGLHLVERNESGWLVVTPDLIRAYLTRPELHPIEESCTAECKLHDKLMRDPFASITADELSKLDDPDALDNYKMFLSLRHALEEPGTIEGAYVAIMRDGGTKLPPMFLDQMVHIILANILTDITDPIRLRAAELFFRSQTVATDEGRIMLADEEIVEMHAASEAETGLVQLLEATGTPRKSVTLDVLDEDNKKIYWDRSDSFDTVVDFRFGQPAPDALARVIESWLRHLMQVEVKVEPRNNIADEDWRWHIGLDPEATRILNMLYEGEELTEDDAGRIVALFRMHLCDEDNVLEHVRGRPVYLALAMDKSKRLKMKPQNLLTNLPLTRSS